MTVTLRRLNAWPERGQGLVEYALILMVIAIALVGTLTLMGNQSNGLYGHILAVMNTVVAGL